MSTSQASLPFAWKEEVNRRLAEHRKRKGSPAAAADARTSISRRGASQRGAEAAARVAERFAQAPSYSEMLVEEARAESSNVAQHAAEQSMFSGFETVKEQETTEMAAYSIGEAAVAPASETAEEPWAMSAAPIQQSVAEPMAIRQEDEPRAEDALSFSDAAPIDFEMRAEEQTETAAETVTDAVEPAQPLNTNLIEFPREVVATRKIRPRLAEGPYAAAPNAQLSIFEVDPGTISTEPAPEAEAPLPAWSEPEWSGLELDADPAEEVVLEEAPATANAAQAAAVIERAPVSRRMLALVVDATLISAALMGAIAAFAANVASLPGPRELGMGAGAAFVAIAVLYVSLFFLLSRATPGMRYARVQLSTFGGERPTRAQRRRRLAGLALSVLPLGLGLVWSLFDEERLCWHDRLSQTYLKGCL